MPNQFMPERHPVSIGERDLLVLIDLQRDFCDGGSLAVPGADSILEPINQLQLHFSHVILTQDWHPANHASFASQHAHRLPAREPFDTIELAYGPQTLWPDHCVQGSDGAKFHPALETTRAELILRKGFHPTIDSYSAFLENDRTTPTGLGGYIAARGFERIFLAGLAYDYCVRYSAVDSLRAGLTTFVIKDACRSIAHDPGETSRLFSTLGIGEILIADLQPAAVRDADTPALISSSVAASSTVIPPR